MTTKRKMRNSFRAAMLLVLAAGYVGCEVSSEWAQRSARDNSIAIMTWNVQLLFDMVEEGMGFRDFQESGGWTREKYMGRLNVIARAIGEMERKPDIIALQEVGSAQVIADLADALSAHRYNWAHFARLPGMAMGVGLLSRYPLEGARAHAIDIDGDIIPRPILEARVNMPGRAPQAFAEGADSLGMDGFSLALFVCHWKSKRGGAAETESTRRAAARVVLRRMRELAQTNPSLPVIVVGDLNVTHDEFARSGGAYLKALMPDDPGAAEFAIAYFFGGASADDAPPANELQRDFLVVSHSKPPEARHFPEGVLALYSPWTVEKEGGSFLFRNSWETIDHFLLSAHLFGGIGWEFYDSQALRVPPFVTAEGLPNAYNPRTGRGISDHVPLMLFLRMRE